MVRRLEMVGYWPGVENGLLDVKRSSDMAECELKMAGWRFKELIDAYLRVGNG